jgi:hypothetical protein
MRRRRHLLQVSTFPFLAVLLCAMGALILLLLVIDRQAKIVARNKALLALAKKSDEQKALDRERLAEWERRRREQRARLEQQRQDLLSAMEKARGQAEASEGELQAEQARQRDLQGQLSAEEASFNEMQEAAKARRAKLDETAKQAEGQRQLLARQKADLDRLDKALKDLKLLRRRAEQTYSVVPFKGVRGGTRRPIYVECTAAGLVFHPERTTLEGLMTAPAAIRAEVKRRVAQQEKEAPVPLDKTSQKPYLLMLVRPDGIANYYRAIRALDGLGADFGYEFIDPEWILDFPPGDVEPVPQPWLTAEDGKKAAGPSPRPGGARAGQPGASSPAGQGQVLSPWSHPPPSPGGAGPGPAGIAPQRIPGGTLPGEPGPLRGAPGQPVSPGSRPVPSGKPGVGQQRPGKVAGAPPAGPAAEKPADEGPAQKPPEHARPDTPSPPREGKPGQGDSQPPPPRLLHEALTGGRGKAPPPLSRLIGNRDWLIYVECKADEVVLRQGGQRFPIAAGPSAPPGEHPLAQAVRALIARRQAVVRPGEPPYRPLIRFQVHPDGLPSYYFAYPLLEPLRIPMSRENVEEPGGFENSR